MTFDNLMLGLNAFLRRRPFLPFVVQLFTGENILIAHPEAFRPHGRAFLYNGLNNRSRVFDAASVCQILDLPPEEESSS